MGSSAQGTPNGTPSMYGASPGGQQAGYSTGQDLFGQSANYATPGAYGAFAQQQAGYGGSQVQSTEFAPIESQTPTLPPPLPPSLTPLSTLGSIVHKSLGCTQAAKLRIELSRLQPHHPDCIAHVVLCTVTFMMHLAAASCIIHTRISTHGMLCLVCRLHMEVFPKVLE